MPIWDSNLGSPPRIARVITQVALPLACASAMETSDYGPFSVSLCVDPADLTLSRAEGDCAAIILVDDEAGGAQDLVASTAREIATFVVVPAATPAVVIYWLQRGAQDVLNLDELGAASLPQRLRSAIERKRIEREARTSYATDLGTGLPHERQLIEHLSQLIALREREPSPMAVLVLRIEGFASTQARFGGDSATVLRRKVAVRLRAGVRASDVVAFLREDCFAVLLGTMLAPADAAQVGAKLLRAMLQPFKLAGNDVVLAVSLGMAQYPSDGVQPDVLLRYASDLAALAPVQGRTGMANFQESGKTAPQAANDD